MRSPPQPWSSASDGRSRRVGGADAVLAALVIAVVGLMVVPLPTWLLDLLIASNLAVSIVILLVTLYVTEPLKIATFPALLLITTLVRLALNVSSTRLILLRADAGEVIRSFGEFVVRGNYIVGAVIFLILTIIQFVVIAKGSERVAEVGARFTLDALPGKQMAIDAELKAGTLSADSARHRRRELARESQFYGAMDGAMKFVKGDVIASFVITLINILGGLAIGVGERGLAVTESLRRYGLLTIGDGLVTQIPALVIATAAGILVTRVAGEDPDQALGDDLSRQLLGSPRALGVAAAFMLILAVVPGLPALPFLVIGVLLFAASRAQRRRSHERATLAGRLGGRERDARRFVPVVTPWSLAVAPGDKALLQPEVAGKQPRRPSLFSVSEGIRECLFDELGVPLPACRILVDETLPEGCVALAIAEVPSARIDVPTAASSREMDEHIRERALAVLRPRAADFVGLSEVQQLLHELEQVAPASVHQVVPKPISLALLTDVLRHLVDEGISIRDLKGILEMLSLAPRPDPDRPGSDDALALAEFVRSQMRRSLTWNLTRGDDSLEVVLLDSNIEESVRGAIASGSRGRFLALAPAARRDIVRAVRRALGDAASATILTQPDIRRFVRHLLESELPQVRVISYAELLPEVSLQTGATATLSGLD